MSVNPELRAQIEDLVNKNEVVLFMKGRRTMPQCGFSAQVVGLLDQLVDDYATVNVLESMDIREGIKAYSDWPTIPQLYIGGKFVGGCDIVTQMFDNGELHSMFGKAQEEVPLPNVTVTEEAARALADALASEPGAMVRFSVDSGFRPALDLGPPQPSDMRVNAGALEILVDRGTAKRSDGTKIDFVGGSSGGFKIDNPNAPARVNHLDPAAVQEKLARGDKFEFLDVRSPEERAMAKIEGTQLLDQALAQKLESLDHDTELVFHCHHGGRSQAAAEHFVKLGFKKVYNMRGGIDAWALMVDNTIPRY